MSGTTGRATRDAPAPTRTARAVRALARLYPWSVGTSDDLEAALDLLGTSLEPETVVRAGYAAGALALVPPFALVASPLPPWLVPVVAVAVALAVVHAVHASPLVLARIRRTRALGETPDLIGRAVLRMGIRPTTEGAARFAADAGRGPLAESLATHVDRAAGTPRSGLPSFAEEWGDRFPALRRSTHLLVAAEDAPPGERGRTLDRALSAVLDGTRDRMAAFTARIRGPTTGLYAFGVMLPLALIALVPAASVAAYPVSIEAFVVAYNLVLPAGLVAAGVWLLSRRPVAFPPPAVGRDHPDVPDGVGLPIGAGVGVGIAAYLAAPLLAPDFLAPVAAVGLGLGTALVALYRPIALVRDRVRAVEANLVDALSLVGQRVAEGEAVESAIERAGQRVPAATGEVFADAAGLQRRLRVDVDDAFRGPHGALADLPSPRARSAAALLAIAAEEGRPAGKAVVSMADHIEELQEVERETRRRLASVTGTLDNTAAIFGPLVAGATVALADGMAGRGAEAADATTLPTDALALVVGVYVVTTCVVLTAISIALRYGLDRPLIGYRVGRALLVATPLYALAVVLAGAIV